MAIKVPGSGPLPARWMLVGEAPGGDEEAKGKPFVGPAGNLLDGVLVAAGLPRGASYVTNVVKFRPPKNKIEEWLFKPDKPNKDNKQPKKAEERGLQHNANGAWYNDQVAEGLNELFEEIERCQPEVIVAFGNTPLWALTGQWGITKWRGSELWYGEKTRLIPTLHPSYIQRGAWAERNLMIHDLRHRVMAKMETPEAGREPKWDFLVGRDFDAIMTRLHEIEAEKPEFISTDVETKRGRIDCYGMASDSRRAVCIPIIDTGLNPVWTSAQLRELNGLGGAILQRPGLQIIGQNFNYDAQYFLRDPDFGWNVRAGHDTKVAQHVLLPGTDKDLVMLSSLYCDWHAYWKDDLKESADNLDDEKRWRYNCRDCCVTYEVAMKQRPLLKKEGYL